MEDKKGGELEREALLSKVDRFSKWGETCFKKNRSAIGYHFFQEGTEIMDALKEKTKREREEHALLYRKLAKCFSDNGDGLKAIEYRKRCAEILNPEIVKNRDFAYPIANVSDENADKELEDKQQLIKKPNPNPGFLKRFLCCK